MEDQTLTNNQPPQENHQYSNQTTNRTYSSFNYQSKTISPIHIVITLGVILFVSIVIISLVNIFRRNPYGPETKISNFSSYYNKTPTNTRDLTFNSLYNIISDNLPENSNVPTSGAKIRKGTNTSEYNPTTNINYYTFMVDIESIKQSYYVQISWTNKTNDDTNLGGYPVLILCPKPDQLIYEPFNCIDSQTELGNTNDPAFSILPVTVAYYNSNNSFIKYEISCHTDSNEADSKINIVITDYTGGNETSARNKIRELGLNPSNYTIQYNDISEGQYLGPAPS